MIVECNDKLMVVCFRAMVNRMWILLREILVVCKVLVV